MSPVTLTAAAEKHILVQMAKQSNACGFYLTVKKTGCSGYAFKPDIVTAVPDNALHFVTPEGLPVYIAKDAASFFQGVVVDYAAEKTGLKQQRLVFINPNETGRCGCGESFTIDK